MMNEPDPYVPPRSEVKVSRVAEEPGAQKQSRGEKVLRRVGAGCVIYLMLGSLFRGASTDLMVKLSVTVVWSLPVLAFLIGGRKLHLVLSLLMLAAAVANAYFMRLPQDFAEVASGSAALRLVVIVILPALCWWVALVCAVALCVKGWKGRA